MAPAITLPMAPSNTGPAAMPLRSAYEFSLNISEFVAVVFIDRSACRSPELVVIDFFSENL